MLVGPTLILGGPSNQLKFGGGNQYTITATPTADRTYTLPDAGANANFVMTQGAQTINGAKTFGSSIIVQPGATIAELKLTTTSGNGLLSRNDGLSTTISNSGGNHMRVGAAVVSTQFTTLDNGSGIGTFLGLNSAYLMQSHAVYFTGTSTTSIPNATFTQPTYTTVTLQDPSIFYNGTNAFTVPATGTYNINAWCRLAD